MYSVRNSDVASVQLLNKGYYMENNNSVNFADYEFIPKLLTQIEKVIIGKHDVVKMLVAAFRRSCADRGRAGYGKNNARNDAR